MSVLGRRISAKLVGALAGLMLLLLALLPAMSSTPAREVHLVVKGMAFYLEDDLQTPNPTIEVKAGERVRVMLRNEDRGMTHDFVVPALGAVLKPIGWNESGTVVLDAPSQLGTYQYVCRPHSLMMRGTIRVVP
jgi:plastocyanin